MRFQSVASWLCLVREKFIADSWGPGVPVKKGHTITQLNYLLITGYNKHVYIFQWFCMINALIFTLQQPNVHLGET